MRSKNVNEKHNLPFDMSDDAVHCAVQRESARIARDSQKQDNFPHRQSADALGSSKRAPSLINTSNSEEMQRVMTTETNTKKKCNLLK